MREKESLLCARTYCMGRVFAKHIALRIKEKCAILQPELTHTNSQIEGLA